MILCRLIAPDWLVQKDPSRPKVLEGLFSEDEIKQLNEAGYNVYARPNYPKEYAGGTVNGTHIDTWEWVFVDYDTKANVYKDKLHFIETVLATGIDPSRIVDSGNGVHVYWRVADLDAKSFLRLSRRLMRLLNTDDAVQTLAQLMRLPGSINTKNESLQVSCEELFSDDITYTCEDLNKLLPPISPEDEDYCETHYNQVHGIHTEDMNVDENLPPKFGKLLLENSEIKVLFTGSTSDRSKDDYRLGHLLFSNNFARNEAMSVLINTAKAMSRAPIHRFNYAKNIVDKIWTYEKDKDAKSLSRNVMDILSKTDDSTLVGDRLNGWKYIDNTDLGFRLGHVLGFVAGSGVGKTSMALNLFLGFVKFNPDYDHFFVPLEQPDREIALRWRTMCGKNTQLHDKVHIISNYDENGTFRDLSLTEIKDHILEFQKTTGKKVGCVVIDHIGVLCNNNKHGQDEGVKEISKSMKGFAIETNTFLIMQSQTSREKAGIGDLELDKNAAFGTSVFENFCDYLVTMWQPLKRVYNLGAPTVLSYKFCKIRHKKQGVDVIQEDAPYMVHYDPETQLINPLTESQEKSISYWVAQATSRRKEDKKTGIVAYKSVKWDDNDSA